MNVSTFYELEAMSHREKLKKNLILTKWKNRAHLHQQNTALTLLIYVLFICNIKMTKNTRQSTTEIVAQFLLSNPCKVEQAKTLGAILKFS